LTIGDRPLDGDEGVIGLIVDGNFSHLISTFQLDVHPPLFHVLTWISTQLFGMHEWSLRLISVLSGIGIVALAPFVVKNYKTPKLWLMLALAASPFLVFVAQDARMYALFGLLALAVWLLLQQIVQPQAKWWQNVLFVMVNIGLIYTHHLGWLVIFMELVVLLGWHWPWFKDHLGKLGVMLAAILISYAPIFTISLNQFMGRLTEQATAGTALDSLEKIIGAVYRFIAGRTFLDLSPNSILELYSNDIISFLALVISVLVSLGLFTAGIYLMGRLAGEVNKTGQSAYPWIRPTLLIMSLAAAVAILVPSIGSQASRYLSFLAPLVIAFPVALIFYCIREAWAKAALITLVAIFMAGLWHQFTVHNQSAGAREYANYIQRADIAKSAVLVKGAFVGGEKYAFMHYYNQIPVYDYFEEYQPGNLQTLKQQTVPAYIQELLTKYQAIWYYDQTYEDPGLETLPRTLTVEKIDLELVDKEGQDLVLYLVQRN
jgi:uncharacterized membrane protein